MNSYYCPTCRRALEENQVFGGGKPDKNGNAPPFYHKLQIYFALTSLMTETEYVPVHESIHSVVSL